MIDRGYKFFADMWLPILDVFKANDVKFALEVHPTEIAYDLVTTQRSLDAVKDHPAFGFNFDPSHFIHQFIDPVEFINEFGSRDFPRACEGFPTSTQWHATVSLAVTSILVIFAVVGTLFLQGMGMSNGIV